MCPSDSGGEYCHVMFLVMSCCYLMTGGYRHERLLLLPCDVAAPPLRGAARPVRLHSGRGGCLPRQDVQTSGVQILVMTFQFALLYCQYCADHSGGHRDCHTEWWDCCGGSQPDFPQVT